jgi:hypothetical protein
VDGDVISQATGAKPRRSLLALARRWGAAAGRIGTPRADALKLFSASRLIVLLAVIAMGATLSCAAIGYGLAQRSDEKLWSEQRAALRTAIAEFRVLFGKLGTIDPRFVHMIEQSARLNGLKFETEPAPGER